jgi:ABC-type glycerol-3-phosphate transport system substrate-binding protein
MSNVQTRRQFLIASGAAGAAVYLAGCGGSDNDSDSAAGGSGDAAKGEISFTTWGAPAEIKAFKAIIASFQQENPGATVKLREVPFEQIRQNVDAGLESGKAPDVFRLTYQDIGFYASQRALLDFSEFNPSGYESEFIEGLWAAVLSEGKPYGVPLHTDVSALAYNKSMFEAAGITSVPTALDEAWSWEEFLDNARKIKATDPAKYAFAYNWIDAGAYRWLNWLWQAGGTLLSDDLTQVTLDTPEATKTMEFFKTWVDEGLIPANNRPKGGRYPDELFPSQTFAMVFTGNWLVPGFADQIKKFEFDVMPLPRDVGEATDLGGNAITVPATSKNPALAAKFAQYMASEKSMKLFCEQAGTLPARTSLADADLAYAVEPGKMKVFQQQAKTLPTDLVRQTSLPKSTQMNTVFVEELEALVARGQDPATTLRNMSSKIEPLLST